MTTPLIRVKEGVQPRLIHLMAALANVGATLTPTVDELWVTAGIDGTHAADSLHYALRAIDIRVHNLTPIQRDQLVTGLKTALGPRNVDCVIENAGQPSAHIHLEWDPRG